MTTQTNLFDPPLSHTKDPASSYEAAQRLEASGGLAKQKTLIYLAIADNQGLTARELSVKTGLDYYIINKRVSLLINDNKIKRGEPRICKYGSKDIKVSTYYVKETTFNCPPLCPKCNRIHKIEEKCNA